MPQSVTVRVEVMRGIVPSMELEDSSATALVFVPRLSKRFLRSLTIMVTVELAARYIAHLLGTRYVVTDYVHSLFPAPEIRIGVCGGELAGRVKKMRVRAVSSSGFAISVADVYLEYHVVRDAEVESRCVVVPKPFEFRVDDLESIASAAAAIADLFVKKQRGGEPGGGSVQEGGEGASE